MKYLFLISIVFIGSSCLRLDSLLFNPDTSIEAYLLEDYTSDHESFFTLGSDADLPSNEINLFILPSTNDKEIYGVYLGDTNTISTDTVIVYNHGNSGNLDWYYQRAKLLANVGGNSRFGVLMIDYSGYGLSSGTPSESNLYDDVDLGMSWLKSKGLTSDRTIIYGFSMGTAPSCELTSKPRSLTPSKIILEAPFASAEVMIQDGSQLAMPGSFLVNLEIDNADEIKNINQPLLWIHGKADDFVNINHGELVYANHSGVYKKAIRIDNAQHSTCPQTLGFEVYKNELLQFILR